RNRLYARRADPVTMRRPLLPKQREAARLLGDQHVPGAALGDRLEPQDEVLVLVELLADEALRLVLVRRDQVGLGLDTEPQRLPFGVEHRRDALAVDRADRLLVERLVDVARERACKDDGVRSLCVIGELLEQHLELLRPDFRAL